MFIYYVCVHVHLMCLHLSHLQILYEVTSMFILLDIFHETVSVRSVLHLYILQARIHFFYGSVSNSCPCSVYYICIYSWTCVRVQFIISAFSHPCSIYCICNSASSILQLASMFIISENKAIPDSITMNMTHRGVLPPMSPKIRLSVVPVLTSWNSSKFLIPEDNQPCHQSIHGQWS